MIRINFKQRDSLITGFECKGHSMSADAGNDIICAFVSSACLMAANTITEVMRLDANSAAQSGYMRLDIKSRREKAQDLLRGLMLHLTELEKDYPENIEVTTSEV